MKIRPMCQPPVHTKRKETMLEEIYVQSYDTHAIYVSRRYRTAEIHGGAFNGTKLLK